MGHSSAPAAAREVTVAAQPRLAIALGDPAGIGPEVALKALAQVDPHLAQTVTLIGNRELALQTYQTLIEASVAPEAIAHPDSFPLVDIPLDAEVTAQIRTGQGNAASGYASFQALEMAIARTLAGDFDGIVTAPISKSAWKSAGFDYPGQTELLAERSQVSRFGMLFVARSPHTQWILRTLLATTHIPLCQVPTVLTPALMTLKLELLMDCLQHDFGVPHPRVAIAGLNPHSGEGGQLGREEVEWMQAWLAEMGDRFPNAILDGLIPPDTLWVKPGQAWYGSSQVVPHDGYLALYHDQGLIPVKLMAFDRAVNTTIGLPFVRTSPDHGTAYDIAGRGIADASSFRSALEFAAEFAMQRGDRPQGVSA
jgi:4-hydroxythreonine-4-phosphate dehydrogenase